MTLTVQSLGIQETNGTPTKPLSGSTNKPNNSIMDGIIGVESQKSTVKKSEFDKKLEQFCANHPELGLSAEALKKDGSLLSKITGKNAQQLNNMPEDQQKRAIDSLNEAIKDATVNGKVDLDLAEKIGKDYQIAQNTGWTIEGFKRHNNQVKKSTLIERLKKTGCLPNNIAKENLSEDQIKDGIKQFFEKVLLGPIGNAKTEKQRKSIYKAQLQTFGRLLINSPEDEKTLFIDVAKSLYSDNRLKGIVAVFDSCETQETRTECAKKASSPEYQKDFTTKGTYNANGELVDDNVMSSDEAMQFYDIVNKNLDEKTLQETIPANHEARLKWQSENKEKLEALEAKITNAKKNGVEPVLTPEEKQLLIEKANYIIAGAAGEISGIASNEIITGTSKNEFLKETNKNAYELSPEIYKEIITQVTEFVEEHPELLTISKEEFVKLLDEATNGNYTNIVKNGENAVINPPAPEANQEASEAENTSANNDFGFGTIQQEQAAAKYLNNQNLQPSVEPKKIEVNKNKTQSTSSYTTPTIEEAFNNHEAFTAYVRQNGIKSAADRFKEFSSIIQDRIAEIVSNFDEKNMLAILNKNSLGALRKAVCKEKGGFDEEFLKKLSAVSSVEKAALGMMYCNDGTLWA